LVECHLAKVDVMGSSPIRRSNINQEPHSPLPIEIVSKMPEEFMKISDFLHKDAICTDLKSEVKVDVISEMVAMLVDAGIIEKKHKNKIVEGLMAREALGSTAIGQGIAIPHTKSDTVKDLIGAMAISKKGVNFDSLDGESVFIFFLLIAPSDSAGPHLKALARISRLLKDKYFRDSLKNAKTAKDVMEIISQQDGRIG
jgi:PTS system nitrogen regulatory IIA component